MFQLLIPNLSNEINEKVNMDGRIEQNLKFNI